MTDKCTYDPTTDRLLSLGMYHCPECGEMVIAGQPHPDYSLINQQKENENVV